MILRALCIKQMGKSGAKAIRIIIKLKTANITARQNDEGKQKI